MRFCDFSNGIWLVDVCFPDLWQPTFGGLVGGLSIHMEYFYIWHSYICIWYGLGCRALYKCNMIIDFHYSYRYLCESIRETEYILKLVNQRP